MLHWLADWAAVWLLPVTGAILALLFYLAERRLTGGKRRKPAD